MSGQPIMIAAGGVGKTTLSEMIVIGHEQGDGAGFSWESPRWRDHDVAAQHLVEHERRFRNAPAPGQRGAIDGYLTIAHKGRSGLPKQMALA
jgi:hypothetical protein